MKNRDTLRAGCLLTVIFVFQLSTVEAKEVFYSLGKDYIRKAVKEDGKFTVEELCKGKIDIKSLNIEVGTIDPGDIFVSSDERYFMFAGAFARKYDRQWFLMDVEKCVVVRELAIGNPAYNSSYYSADFSPDSTKLYVSWKVVSRKKDENVPDYLTKEYSGEKFGEEKVLRNVFIPWESGSHEISGLMLHRFSRDGNRIVVRRYKEDVYLSVHDIMEDAEVFRMRKDYFGSETLGEKFIKGERVPDISNDQLLFNFKKVDGSEINIFDYKDKQIKKKIQVSSKGIGRFSSKGDKIVFTEFPDPKTRKKRAILFETETGKQLGNAILDENDEAIDATDDGREIIIKQERTKKRIKVE